MSRKWAIAVGILAVAVLLGVISFHGLQKRIQRLARAQTSEEQARREVLATPISSPTDVVVQAKIFWATKTDQIAPVNVPLALSADPTQRSKQVLEALMMDPPAPEQRTIPSDAELLAFYVLPDGTAIADFSEEISSKTPSGILSEGMAVDSIARTLESNVPALHRLKILVHGQEADTLAGHLDLAGFFDLNPPGNAIPAASGVSLAPGASSPALSSGPDAQRLGAMPVPQSLKATPTPGRVSQ